MTFPEIKDFFNRYVQGNESLPLKKVFDYVGINYAAEERFMDYSLGISYSELDVANIDSKPKLQIIHTENLNEMGKALGFKEGDVLVAINEEPLPDLGPELGTFITKHFRSLPKTDTLTYTVSRKNEVEVWQEVKLSAPVKKVENIRRHVMIPNPLATQEQLKLREAWLKSGT
jgi:predicted metalloprotease with PDZ domain